MGGGVAGARNGGVVLFRNETYDVYQFFASDLDGRTAEFQYFY